MALLLTLALLLSASGCDKTKKSDESKAEAALGTTVTTASSDSKSTTVSAITSLPKLSGIDGNQKHTVTRPERTYDDLSSPSGVLNLFREFSFTDTSNFSFNTSTLKSTNSTSSYSFKSLGKEKSDGAETEHYSVNRKGKNGSSTYELWFDSKWEIVKYKEIGGKELTGQEAKTKGAPLILALSQYCHYTLTHANMNMFSDNKTAAKDAPSEKLDFGNGIQEIKVKTYTTPNGYTTRIGKTQINGKSVNVILESTSAQTSKYLGIRVTRAIMK